MRIRDLVSKLMRVEEISEDDLHKEKNFILSKVPVAKQSSALQLWDNEYYYYRKSRLENGDKFYKVEGLFYANECLRKYQRRMK